MKALTQPLLLLIRWYQLTISAGRPPCCKYYPSCSNYAMGALQTHGIIKGLVLTLWRLARCNPLSNGGVDYPPLAGTWRAAPYHQMSDAELRAHWDRVDADQGALAPKYEENC